jgi:nucleoside 2-deoxyribosyltransferase
MKVYIAGPWADRSLLAEVHQSARQAGLDVVSHWVEQDGADGNRACAMCDLAELQMADALLLVNSGLSEGKAVELGYALATHKLIVCAVVSGTVSNNIFLNLPQVICVGAIPQAIDLLADLDLEW